MGYQSQYEDSVSHAYVFYTNEIIDDIARKYVEMPRDPVYRDDEISIIISRLIPYCILVVLLYLVLVLAQVFFLKRSINYNFKRLLSLGANASKLNNAYTGFICLVSLGSGCMALIASSCIALSFGIIRMFSFVLLIILIAHIIVLFSFITISKKRMWRN